MPIKPKYLLVGAAAAVAAAAIAQSANFLAVAGTGVAEGPNTTRAEYQFRIAREREQKPKGRFQFDFMQRTPERRAKLVMENINRLEAGENHASWTGTGVWTTREGGREIKVEGEAEVRVRMNPNREGKPKGVINVFFRGRGWKEPFRWEGTIGRGEFKFEKR